MDEWIPKTDVGRKVKNRQIIDINEILDNGWSILEPEITEYLLPDMQNDLLLIGQSKGKFGGGRRRVFRQTQKKTREGNKPRFAAYAVVGNGDGIIGLGYGKARETVPARDKAMRQAKINVFKIARGSGSWESTVQEPHTVPFAVEGKCGSVVVRLIPAPKGKGLVAEKEMQKILKMAGIEDVWTETWGQTKNKVNLVKATEAALRKLTTTKLRPQDYDALSVHFGNVAPIAIRAREDFQAVAKHTKGAHARKDAKPRPAKPAAPPVERAPAEVPVEVLPPQPVSTSGMPLTALKGVGPATADKLHAAAIIDVETLFALTSEEVVARAGVSLAQAKKLLLAAQEVLGGGQ